MKFSLAFIVLVASIASIQAANLPTLNALQTKYANATLARANVRGVGRQGCKAAIATALAETSLIMYANRAVPESLNLPHDRVGTDHDCIAIFNQRASIYRNIKADMDAGASADMFFAEMKKVQGWQTMAVGTLAQKVQRGAYPDRYAKQAGPATQICAVGGP